MSDARDGGRQIAAARLVPASQEDLFEFLSDLENHWLLADRFIQVLSLERRREGASAHGGRVRMRGPLGVRRTAVTRVVEVDPPHHMAGSADLFDGTQAHVSWTFTSANGGTLVRLKADIVALGLLDRALLALGGRRLLRKRFGAILETLERRLHAPATEVVGVD